MWNVEETFYIELSNIPLSLRLFIHISLKGAEKINHVVFYFDLYVNLIL